MTVYLSVCLSVYEGGVLSYRWQSVAHYCRIATVLVVMVRPPRAWREGRSAPLSKSIRLPLLRARRSSGSSASAYGQEI